ncbi:MAG: hypothetical protein ACK5H1_07160 [Tenacibaculum sp.]
MDICANAYKYKLIYSQRKSYLLDLGYKKVSLTFCQLLAFRKKILQYSSLKSLEEILNKDNYILLLFADNQHLLFLDVEQLLKLRNLVLSFFEKQKV